MIAFELFNNGHNKCLLTNVSTGVTDTFCQQRENIPIRTQLKLIIGNLKRRLAMKGHLARVAIIASLHLVSANYQQEPEEVVFDWSSWWSYDGISGPGFWGIINRRWRLCSDGRRQSPVDLATAAVVYDHTLSRLDLASHKIDGTLSNTGFGLRWTANAGQTWGVTGGPLHYAHTLTHAVLRWSNASPATSTVGSEHSIEGQFFPAEIQLYFYNSDLYQNFSQALDKPNGVLGVSVLLKGRIAAYFLRF
nr:carbonic anhydrase-related protein 10-like [Penaeus vannamei]